MNALSLYLQNLFVPLVKAIGADVKSLRMNSATMSVNAATRLIQTQRIVATMAAKGTTP